MYVPVMLSVKLLFETFSLAQRTVSMDMSVARKLHLFKRVPKRGYIQEVPVPRIEASVVIISVWLTKCNNQLKCQNQERP